MTDTTIFDVCESLRSLLREALPLVCEAEIDRAAPRTFKPTDTSLSIRMRRLLDAPLKGYKYTERDRVERHTRDRLRREYATAALSGILAGAACSATQIVLARRDLAETCWAIADTMLAADPGLK